LASSKASTSARTWLCLGAMIVGHYQDSMKGPCRSLQQNLETARCCEQNGGAF
jgi:hypothetical protein